MDRKLITPIEKNGIMIMTAEDGFGMTDGNGFYALWLSFGKNITPPKLYAIPIDEYNEAIAAANSVTNEEALYGHQF